MVICYEGFIPTQSEKNLVEGSAHEFLEKAKDVSKLLLEVNHIGPKFEGTVVYFTQQGRSQTLQKARTLKNLLKKLGKNLTQSSRDTY